MTAAPQLHAPRGVALQVWERHHFLLESMAREHEAWAGERGALRLPRDDQSWRAMLAAAEWQRVLPPVIRQLATADGVPDWVRERLARAATEDTARALMLGYTRQRALSALAERRIPAMLLKGSVLTEAVYPPGVMRDMSDIDILVTDLSLGTAVDALKADGFRSQARSEAGRSGPEPRHADALIIDGGMAWVELHRRLADHVDERRFRVAEVWDRARASAVGDHLLPSGEDLLIHVCLHFLEGRSVRSEGALGQIRDIAWIVERGEVNWPGFHALIERYGVRERVLLALGAAEQLGQLPAGGALGAARPDVLRTERFIATRVLIDRRRAPIGTPSAYLKALRPPPVRHRGSNEPTPAADPGTGGTGTRLASALREVRRSPVMAIRDLRTGAWLRRLS